MATGLNSWSTTAATNATADSAVNWAEGMAPSAVNDSARAMMASAAKWRKDNNGSLTTGGTSTAFTVTSNQSFGSLSEMDGATLRLRFNATNGSSPTLNVDGLGAKSLIVASGTAVPASFLASSCTYDVVYDNAIPGWICVNSQYQFFQSGTRMIFQQSAAPTGWAKDTSSTDFALRVTNDNVTTHAGTGFATVFAARTITQANLPSYTIPNTLGVTGTVSYNTGAGTVYCTTSLESLGSSGIQNMQRANTTTAAAFTFSGSITGSITSGGSGTTMDFNVAYKDVIIAEKA